jgi:hypothetical protein
MIAKVTSQTNTSNYAVAGLMIRDSLNANAAQAVVGVSPMNGVNFTYRATDGGSSNTMLGPSIAAPIWLRIVRSQSSIAGYQSSDGISWQLVGEQPITLPTTFYIGFAVSSNSYGNLSTVVFNNVAYMTSVPQRSANLVTWLRADAGVVYSSGQVSSWLDQSGNGNNGTQLTSGNQPSLVTGAINGLPAVGFNGTSQYLQLPSGYSNFSSGVSIFVVTKPTSFTQYGHLLYLARDTSGTDAVSAQEWTTSGSASLTVVNGTNQTQVTASSALTLNAYQLFETVDSGGSGPVGTLYTNGVQQAQGTLNTLNNVFRTNNYIGGVTYYFAGQIAEILIYNTGVTPAQRASIESYILSKYAIGNQPTLDAPVITPSNSVYSTPTQSVSITQDQGAQIWYTTNGSTPIPGTSPQYTGAFNVSGSTTVNAIASAPFFVNSPVTSAYIQYDPTTANINRTGLLAWYKADNGVTTSGSNVTQWADVSGNGNYAFQSSSSNQPHINTGAVNGLPVINFNGTSQFLQLPAGFNFTSGNASMFIVTKPAAFNAAGDRFLDIGNGDSSGTNSLGFSMASSTAANFFVFNGIFSSSLSTAMTLNQYQLLEGIQSGSSSGSVYTNGALATGSPGLLNNIPSGSHSTNYIRQFTNGGFYLQGTIAEILIYNAALNSSDRQSVEYYLMNRYALGVEAPVITVNPTTSLPLYTTPVTVTISAAPGARIFYTLNGSTPSASSLLYSGSFVVTQPTTIKAIAIQTFGTSPVATLTLNVDPNAAPILTPGPLTWLRSDMGVSISSGSSVNSWADMSGTGNFAGSSGSAQPTLVKNAINGYPALSFNGGNSYMQWPTIANGFANGVSVFVVANCNAVNQSGDRFIELSTGSGANSIALYAYSSTVDGYFTSNGAGSGSSAGGNMTTNQYQLLEAMQNSSGAVAMYTNGIFGASSTLTVPPSASRNVNYIGQYSGGGYFLQGQIAEILLYNTALTAAQRTAIEGYLLQKYQIGIPSAPIISVPGGSLSGPTQVAIAAQAGSSIFFTTDGSTPTTSSNSYLSPINVYYSQTLKAIAVRNGVQSSVSTAAYTLNSTQWPAPSSSDSTPLQIQLRLPTNAVPQ